MGLTVPALLLAGLAFAVVPAAAATTTPGSATYTVGYTCVGGCWGGPYVHSYTVSSDCTGAFSGTGASVGAVPAVTETLTGRTFVDPVSKTTKFEFTATYITGNPGYVITASGDVNPLTGALSGTASGPGQAFSLTATRDTYTAPTCTAPPVEPPLVAPPTTGDQKGSVENKQEGSLGEVDEVVERNELRASESRD